MKSKIYVICTVLLFVAFSCKKETNSTDTNTGVYTDYYPLSIGSYHSYLVDSTYYNDFTGETEVYQYQLKEVITDTFLDESNLMNYRMERYCKFKPSASATYDTLPWVFKNVWFVTVTDVSIQRVEENIRFINLTNPIKDGVTWDGNNYNPLSTFNYTYESFGTTLLGYENAVKVLQIDVENLIEKQYYEQVFAKDIGLIRYYYMDVESQDISNVSIPVSDRIEKGIIFSKVLFDHSIAQ